MAATLEWTNLSENNKMKYDVVVVVADLVWHGNELTNCT